MLKLRDADTGESSMDIVEVPEGLSLQLGYTHSASACCDDFGYISIILDRQGEDELFRFLLRRQQDIANRFSGSLGW